MIKNYAKTILRTHKNYNILSSWINKRNQNNNANINNDETAKFGFEQVKIDEKQTKVNKVFSDVAETYDLMNDLMSFGMHRLWKEKLIRKISPNPQIKLIDVASGTGDIAFRYLYHLKNTEPGEIINKVTLCDINPNMLEVGRKRAAALGYEESINFVVSNAESLDQIPDLTFDVYTISFGIRNCTRLDKVLKEAYRVLNKGGRVLVMEFSQVNNEYFRKIYDSYSFNVIPLTGQLIAGDWNSYQYLVESIRVFPNQEEFSELMRNAGFKNVTYENINNGIVAIYSGFKI